MLWLARLAFQPSPPLFEEALPPFVEPSATAGDRTQNAGWALALQQSPDRLTAKSSFLFLVHTSS
jgi:hypothetical protein